MPRQLPKHDADSPDPKTKKARPVAQSPEPSKEEPDPWTDRTASARALRAAQARNQSTRRRLVDPATCERDYSMAELEFMSAMETYKKQSGRMFPTWSEVLEVLFELGYRKENDPGVQAAAI